MPIPQDDLGQPAGSRRAEGHHDQAARLRSRARHAGRRGGDAGRAEGGEMMGGTLAVVCGSACRATGAGRGMKLARLTLGILCIGWLTSGNDALVAAVTKEPEIVLVSFAEGIVINDTAVERDFEQTPSHTRSLFVSNFDRALAT